MKHPRKWQCGFIAAMILLTPGLAGCGDDREAQAEQHYTSPTVQGEKARINLEAVEKAFWSSKGNDFNGWMGGFEQRVNEIYEGSELVAIDASRKKDMLTVTGFIDKNEEPGFQAGDDKLFAIEQTGAAANDQVPYRVSSSQGQVYHEGHHSLLDNPFLQGLLIAGAINSFGGFGGRYHTPRDRYVVLQDHRTSYRTSADYDAQRKANTSFSSRFKRKTAGSGLESSRKFGASTTGTDKKRSWTGKKAESTSSTSGAGSSWSGRRPSAGSSGSSSSSSSWSGRRSSSSSSSSRRSWGGRRR